MASGVRPIFRATLPMCIGALPPSERTPWSIVQSQAVDSSDVVPGTALLGAEAEIERLEMRSLFAPGAGKRSSVGGHVRFRGPQKGIAHLVGRRFYWPVGELLIAFGATEDPSRHTGVHE